MVCFIWTWDISQLLQGTLKNKNTNCVWKTFSSFKIHILGKIYIHSCLDRKKNPSILRFALNKLEVFR